MSDEHLGTWKVGSDGFVRLVDYWGDEGRIVQSARVSYGKGTKSTSDDVSLIKYMLRNFHSSVFEHVGFTIHIRLPIYVARQLWRHRVLSINEVSARYSVMDDTCERINPEDWRKQSSSNRQGSEDGEIEFPEGYRIREDLFVEYENDKGWTDATPVYSFSDGPITAGEYLSQRQDNLQEHIREVYEERLKFGVAREMARTDMPVSVYTEAYLTCDLHNWMNILKLRMDHHAQQEIREFAEVIGNEIIARLFPNVWEAFKAYRLEAMTLTKYDIEALRYLTAYNNRSVSAADAEDGIMCAAMQYYLPIEWAKERCRERDECIEKLKRLGLVYG